jgi:hypothetical protein
MASRSLRISIVIISALLGMTACVSTGQLQLISAGHTGCMPDQITISNAKGDAMWTATCNGKAYLCTGVSTGKNSADYSCAPAQ